jgi:hypothetical protein
MLSAFLLPILLVVWSYPSASFSAFKLPAFAFQHKLFSTPPAKPGRPSANERFTGIIPSGDSTSSTSSTPPQPEVYGDVSEEAIQYFNIIENIKPHVLLTKFAQSAPANVQNAAKTTIMNLLGAIPNYAMEASMVTTNTRMANLLYQMQITGYMFKNAEYQLSMTKVGNFILFLLLSDCFLFAS